MIDDSEHNCIQNVITVLEASRLRGVTPQAIRDACRSHWQPIGKARQSTQGVKNWLIDSETARKHVFSKTL